MKPTVKAEWPDIAQESKQFWVVIQRGIEGPMTRLLGRPGSIMDAVTMAALSDA